MIKINVDFDYNPHECSPTILMVGGRGSSEGLWVRAAGSLEHPYSVKL